MFITWIQDQLISTIIVQVLNLNSGSALRKIEGEFDRFFSKHRLACLPRIDQEGSLAFLHQQVLSAVASNICAEYCRNK